MSALYAVRIEDLGPGDRVWGERGTVARNDARRPSGTAVDCLPAFVGQTLVCVFYLPEELGGWPCCG